MVDRTRPLLLRIRRSTCAAVFGAVLVAGTTATLALASTALPENVRSTDSQIVDLLREGARRSATFRTLLSTLAESRDVVYVEFGYCAFGRLNACLLPMTVSAGGPRYLRIVLRRDSARLSHDRLVSVLAHELQHAIEVTAAPGVTTIAALDAMFARIGYPIARGLPGYETSAAHAAADAVLTELTNASQRCARPACNH